MLKRVFIYSNEAATINKKNFTKFDSILLMFSLIAPFILLTVFTISHFILFDSKIQNPFNWIFNYFIHFLLISFLIFTIYFSKFIIIKKQSCIAYAISDKDNVYRISGMYNGFAPTTGRVVGEAVGSLVSNETAGGSIGSIIGTSSAISQLYNNEEFISDANNVEYCIENKDNIKSIFIQKIIKVYSYKETKHSLKIVCDYYNYYKNKTQIKKSITIMKNYNYYDDLKNMIISMK